MSKCIRCGKPFTLAYGHWKICETCGDKNFIKYVKRMLESWNIYQRYIRNRTDKRGFPHRKIESE